MFRCGGMKKKYVVLVAIVLLGAFLRFYGIGEEGSGYERIAYTIHLKAPGATTEQVAFLKDKCERYSPVGHSLTNAIPLTLAIQVE